MNRGANLHAGTAADERAMDARTVVDGHSLDSKHVHEASWVRSESEHRAVDRSAHASLLCHASFRVLLLNSLSSTHRMAVL